MIIQPKAKIGLWVSDSASLLPQNKSHLPEHQRDYISFTLYGVRPNKAPDASASITGGHIVHPEIDYAFNPLVGQGTKDTVEYALNRWLNDDRHGFNYEAIKLGNGPRRNGPTIEDLALLAAFGQMIREARFLGDNHSRFYLEGFWDGNVQYHTSELAFDPKDFVSVKELDEDSEVGRFKRLGLGEKTTLVSHNATIRVDLYR